MPLEFWNEQHKFQIQNLIPFFLDFVYESFEKSALQVTRFAHPYPVDDDEYECEDEYEYDPSGKICPSISHQWVGRKKSKLEAENLAQDSMHQRGWLLSHTP